MAVQYKPLREWFSEIDQEEYVDKLFSNVSEFINTHYKCKTQIDKDSASSLYGFLDEFLGLSTGIFLDYFEDFNEVIETLVTVVRKDHKTLGYSNGISWSAAIAIHIYNEDLIKYDDDSRLIFSTSAARKMLDGTRNQTASKLKTKIGIEPNSVIEGFDSVALIWIGLNTGFTIENNSSTSLPKKFTDDVGANSRKKIKGLFTTELDELGEKLMNESNESKDDEDQYWDGSDIDSVMAEAAQDNRISVDMSDIETMPDNFDLDAFYENETTKKDGEKEQKDQTSGPPATEPDRNLLAQQKNVARSLLKRDNLQNKLGDPSAIEDFIKNFEPTAEFIGSIEKNTRTLVLGLTALMGANEDPKDIELLEQLLRRVKDFNAEGKEDENILFAIIMIAGFESAYARTIKDAQMELSQVPNLIKNQITDEIKQISLDAERNAQKLTSDMASVTAETKRWAEDMAEYIEKFDQYTQDLPVKISTGIDKAINIQSERMFLRAASVLKKNEEQTKEIAKSAKTAQISIKKAGNAFLTKAALMLIVLVPTLVLGAIYIIEKLKLAA